jgi:hypothetical protein
MDADSLIDEVALSQIFRILLERKDVAAVGGQVVVANGCKIADGKVLKVGLPKSHLARFQIIEYVRSFTMARTALSRINGLLIISGVFCIFEKELLIRVGGYLTEHVQSRLSHEYAGRGSSTVCEDMEIVVRLHRYIKEKGLDKVIVSLPYPICWTEVPERASDLAKQRGRWFRGFVEIMVYHRAMLFNPRYGMVGMFGWPWLVVYDFLGTFIEAFGYVSLPFLALFGFLSIKYLWVFLGVSFAYGALISIMSLLIAFWSEPTSHHDARGHTLLAEMTARDKAILVLYCILENFGFRQMTITCVSRAWSTTCARKRAGRSSIASASRRSRADPVRCRATNPGAFQSVLQIPVSVFERQSAAHDVAAVRGRHRVERVRAHPWRIRIALAMLEAPGRWRSAMRVPTDLAPRATLRHPNEIVRPPGHRPARVGTASCWMS